MKTNHYESVIIFNATLEDSQIESILTSLQEQMTANGVEFSNVEKLGRKRLAYQIQKGKSGFYVILQFASPREYIAKFERNLRLDENIIRFLTIKLEQKDLDFIAKQKVEQAEEAAKPVEVVEEAVKTEVSETTEEVTEEAKVEESKESEE